LKAGGEFLGIGAFILYKPGMEETRFFYSTDGTDVHGPVTEAGLRLLFRDRTMGPSSYLCREGENEWQPVNPEFFQTPPPPPQPRPPPPPSPRREPVERQPSLGEFLSRTPVRVALLAISGVVSVGTALLLTHAGPAHAGTATPSYTAGYVAGSFTGHILIILAIPYLVSLAFRRSRRILVRTIGIVLMAALILIGRFSEAASTLRLQALASQIDDQTKTEAQAQLKTKGFFSGDTQEAETNLQKIRNQLANDDSLTARVARDLLNVTETLLEKVRLSNEAEATCRFDPATIASPQDITDRQASLAKLRETQTDTLAYLQDFDAQCRQALAPDHFSDATVDGALAGARKAGHIDLLINLWQIKVKLTDDHAARLAFLGKTWGLWEGQNGKLLFRDDATLASYNTYIHDIRDDVKQIGDVQRQIFQ
jgi:hypothetical protein